MSVASTSPEQSTLGLSDEEFLAMDPSQFESEWDVAQEGSQEMGEALEENESDDELGESTEDTGDAEEAEESGEAGDTGDSDAEDDATEAEDAGTNEDESGDTADTESDETEDSESTEDDGEAESDSSGEEAPVDYKEAYERITAPFRANGKEMKVESVDEAISLMQMGANYNKKMAALKPSLKVLKMLENNKLLDESKLNFLVDLDKKNPEAIKKLIKESGVDPLDLNIEEESEYKPNTYTVNDSELELDAVLDEIQDTPTYGKTLEVVSNKWDSASKRVIAGSPQLLKVINDHMASGIYDRISKEIERERMFGRLQGVSDLDAYKQVGDALDAKGEFNQLVQQNQRQKPVAQKKLAPKPRKEDSKLKSKKRAASPTKAAAATKTDTDYNPLAMSDEEFSELIQKQLL